MGGEGPELSSSLLPRNQAQRGCEPAHRCTAWERVWPAEAAWGRAPVPGQVDEAAMNGAALVGEGPRWGTAPSRFCAPEGAAQPGRRLLDADSWATPALQGSTPARGPGAGIR